MVQNMGSERIWPRFPDTFRCVFPHETPEYSVSECKIQFKEMFAPLVVCRLMTRDTHISSKEASKQTMPDRRNMEMCSRSLKDQEVMTAHALRLRYG